MAELDPHAILGHGLHDATLRVLAVEWSTERAVLRVVLALFDGEVVVATFEPLRKFDASRADPWGQSDSINDASLLVAHSGQVSWTVEMQSGDEISVVAGTVRVEQARSAPGQSVDVETARAASQEFARRYEEDHPAGGLDALSEHLASTQGQAEWDAALAAVLAQRSRRD